MAQTCIQNCFTFNQTQDCFTVFCDVFGGKEEKSSTQDPNKRAEQEAELQAVEAPVQIARFRGAYSIRDLPNHRGGGQHQGQDSSCWKFRCHTYNSSHHSYQVRTPGISQEMSKRNLQRFSCSSSGWYDNILEEKSAQKTTGWCKVSVKVSRIWTCKLTSRISAMTAQFRESRSSPKKIKTWKETLKIQIMWKEGACRSAGGRHFLHKWLECLRPPQRLWWRCMVLIPACPLHRWVGRHMAPYPWTSWTWWCPEHPRECPSPRLHPQRWNWRMQQREPVKSADILKCKD